MNIWKAVHITLPATLTAHEISDHVIAQIRIIATEAGEFVNGVRVGLPISRSDGWCIWTASYLPGPPTAFPASVTASGEPRIGSE